MKIHFVKEGDTLYKLSQKYGVTLNALIDANPIVSGDPDHLVIGMKLKIPAGKGTAPMPKPQTATMPPKADTAPKPKPETAPIPKSMPIPIPIPVPKSEHMPSPQLPPQTKPKLEPKPMNIPMPQPMPEFEPIVQTKPQPPLCPPKLPKPMMPWCHPAHHLYAPMPTPSIKAGSYYNWPQQPMNQGQGPWGMPYDCGNTHQFPGLGQQALPLPTPMMGMSGNPEAPVMPYHYPFTPFMNVSEQIHDNPQQLATKPKLKSTEIKSNKVKKQPIRRKNKPVPTPHKQTHDQNLPWINL